MSRQGSKADSQRTRFCRLVPHAILERRTKLHLRAGSVFLGRARMSSSAVSAVADPGTKRKRSAQPAQRVAVVECSGRQADESAVGRGANRASSLAAPNRRATGSTHVPEVRSCKCWRGEPGIAWIVTPLRTVVSVVLSHYPASRALMAWRIRSGCLERGHGEGTRVEPRAIDERTASVAWRACEAVRCRPFVIGPLHHHSWPVMRRAGFRARSDGVQKPRRSRHGTQDEVRARTTGYVLARLVILEPPGEPSLGLGAV
jgi:hypothetical protein